MGVAAPKLDPALRKDVIHPEWLQIYWPNHWHYDFFHGLRAMAMLGKLRDPRAALALEHLLARRRPDGTWRVSGRRYWRRIGAAPSSVDVVDWGDAHEIVTTTARRLLGA